MPEIAKWQQVYSQQKWKNMAGVFCRIVNGHQITVKFGEKTTSISQRHQRYPHEISSEEQAQNFHTDDTSPPRSG